MRVVFILLLLFSTSATADLVLNYNGFYARMKMLQQPEYSDITLAFALTSLQDGSACKFYSLKLISQQHDIALELSDDAEIMLPYDEALKNANATLQVLQADNASPCQIEMRVRSRIRLPQQLTLQQLQHFRTQFELLLDDMAGLSKYWLPDVTGVIAEFNDTPMLLDAPPAVVAATECTAHRCAINVDTLSAQPQSSWTFSQRPRYLLPLIASSAK